MKRLFATICAALLLAGAAAAGDPGKDAARALEAREEARVAALVENQTESALRYHKVVAEAMLEVGDCRGATDSAEARAQSASERHRRLIDCFARQRAKAGLIAANPD